MQLFAQLGEAWSTMLLSLLVFEYLPFNFKEYLLNVVEIHAFTAPVVSSTGWVPPLCNRLNTCSNCFCGDRWYDIYTILYMI